MNVKPRDRYECLEATFDGLTVAPEPDPTNPDPVAYLKALTTHSHTL